jgi:hypothetical protein
VQRGGGGPVTFAGQAPVNLWLLFLVLAFQRRQLHERRSNDTTAASPRLDGEEFRAPAPSPICAYVVLRCCCVHIFATNMAAEAALDDVRLGRLSDDEWELIIGHLLSFRAASSFGGRWPGWVFKMDVHGLGYYIDKRPAEVALLRLAATCRAARRRVIPRLVPYARRKLLQAAGNLPDLADAQGFGRYLAETAMGRCQWKNGGVTISRVAALIKDTHFVQENANSYMRKHAIDLTELVRKAVVPSMLFARSVNVPADSTTEFHGQQLVVLQGNRAECVSSAISMMTTGWISQGVVCAKACVSLRLHHDSFSNAAHIW